MLSQDELSKRELTHEELGDRVRERRRELGLSQEKLAEKAQVSKETIGRLEQGGGTPSLFTVRKVANALGETVSALLAGQAGDEVSALVQALPEYEQQIACVMVRALSAHVKAQ
ncbi:transcriptional regulator [Plesiocystis pacifica SIR-1]|uniref:Transcriptional regulator n=1 Tax=Plesiocystis pacifica SIR-1 TaxID=391625 RepID=A6G6R0_9BACT|nr:helix-turn-helix transcriptional regulator [Plesiocystis pacifica]EDM78363.1 transcriptional regulator [Plesiocystis pacifica SIR-1]